MKYMIRPKRAAVNISISPIFWIRNIDIGKSDIETTVPAKLLFRPTFIVYYLPEIELGVLFSSSFFRNYLVFLTEVFGYHTF